MSMIKVENLTFSYPTSYDVIFDNVSFQIDTDWKLGFVGRNGRGKTTFLNLLLGNYEYSGKIISSVQFDYFPYPVSDEKKQTEELLREVCPLAEEWELLKEFSYLDVDADVLWRSFETLSKGEQTKVLLAALFLNEGHFLLIDEPTNHLDTDARKKVAEYLKKKKGFILVSHDRRFLDECVDHILSINRTNIEVQMGNFSSWMVNFERKQESELLQKERLKKDIHRLQKSAKRSETWSNRVEASKIGAADKGYVGHKSAKMMKRSKTIEKRRQKAIEEKSKLLKNAETADVLKMKPLMYHTNTLVSFSEVEVMYEGRTICSPMTFDIQSGDRVFIEGKNGSGKSSLLKLLMGNFIEHTGKVTVGSGLVISYVPQDTSYLTGFLEDFSEKNGLDESLFKAVLRKLDFDRIQFEKDMKEFSGGQKKKVLIAKSLCEQAHLYVWDEPLNFIDVYSRLQIEKLIEEFSPTMLFVEHDLAFRDAIATKIIKI
ncbi:Lsa family ABC-F type ribosomal protection protein [Mediterraneibacter glycyrrhizinilyticus]|uniref:Lsa family ABC-F type ribosomal protection protein n=1 Tax=Mediterraneibacter glycyrrhizinilyticus TaxID=342942 RepID=UPI001D085255|nr:Lsa family ABC-F type ribosomal protection protein [Mediterraneibacter glycyrrhizinilyticus]MCB6309640.1 Lsa family ABC-F type ribosomal protection protein [Lachnospiraceae bacterium 210521-DFI.1.109]MCB6427260.1 Lsa family ABC-F type ribosomal protection protein [Mediterraneibacter glycyrrhizinilyticus]